MTQIDAHDDDCISQDSLGFQSELYTSGIFPAFRTHYALTTRFGAPMIPAQQAQIARRSDKRETTAWFLARVRDQTWYEVTFEVKIDR